MLSVTAMEFAVNRRSSADDSYQKVVPSGGTMRIVQARGPMTLVGFLQAAQASGISLA